MRRVRFILCAISLFVSVLLWPHSILAKSLYSKPSSVTPFSTRTQNPLYLQFLSMTPEGAPTLQKGYFEAKVDMSYSNIFEYWPEENETIFYDMELWRNNFSFKYGLSRRLDLAIEMPVLIQTGGFLDSFIEGYHKAFGFPNGGRELESKNNFRFYLSKNNKTLFDYNQQNVGLGDALWRLKYNFTRDDESRVQVSVAGYVKLPTGEVSQGLSSGRADWGMSAFMTSEFKRFVLHSQLGSVIVGGHSWLDEDLLPLMIQFNQTVAWKLSPQFAVLAQINGHSPLFQNFEANPMSAMAMDLSLGISGAKIIRSDFFAEEFFYNLSFSEDVLSLGPSVDFTLQLSLGWRY